MMFQVSGGPSARAAVFAMLRLVTRYALSPAEACRCNICIRRPHPLKPWFSTPFLPWSAISKVSGCRGTLHIHYIVRQAARAVLILRSSFRPNFLTIFCTPSLILPIVPPTLNAPLVGRGYTPLIVLSSLARKPSRLYALTETFIGVVCDKPLFFKVDCPFHGQEGDELA